MNITTNKDFFTDEGPGRKPDRRRGRRKAPLPIAENKISTTTSLPLGGRTPRIVRPIIDRPALPMPDPLVAPAAATPTPPAAPTPPARRTAFYQAAAPRKREDTPGIPAIPAIPPKPTPAQLPPRPLSSPVVRSVSSNNGNSIPTRTITNG
jgi:hypothetical protein